MGLAIDREEFSEDEFAQFSERLYECLTALKYQLRKPGFGLGTQKIGAELENYIVDRDGGIMPINKALIERSGNKNYTVELNKFNLEINFDPIALDPTAFSSLENEMNQSLEQLRSVATEFDAQVIPIGILPTLRENHLTSEFITDFARYRALSKHLLEMRGENFQVDIRGEDEIKLDCDHVALEGANTSFQFHLMVKPNEFADVFNATQLITPLITAISANSPILLNKFLWDETRIALFKQSIDSRVRNSFDWRQPARVSFGHGWVRDDAWELFAETVALYPPIFPILSDENPLTSLKEGKTPKLDELSLHMGTTWPWNRAVYSGSDDGHIRIEMRALPAGPTCADMTANAALATGLAIGFSETIRDFLAVLPFRFAEYNFYRAAQKGLDASIIWTHSKKHQLIELPIADVIFNMLPIAEYGLKKIGVGDKDIRHYLSIIEKRLTQKRTGARWQRVQVKDFEKKSNRTEACERMLACYIDQQRENKPISEWEII